MGTSQVLWGQPEKMLGGNLKWTSIPSRGSRYTPSHFILQKPETSAGTDGPSGSDTQLRLGQTSSLMILRCLFSSGQNIRWTATKGLIT